MELKLLEDALILIEEGSMSAAAARRNVTQPAFSRRIRALEDWLNVPLVERHANRIVLTQNLLEREAEIRTLQASFQRLRSHDPARKRTFVVAAQHSLATSVFPEIYKKLRALDTIGPIRLRTRNQDEVIALFLKSEVDLVLRYQREETPHLPFDDTVSQGIWRRDTLVPVVGGALRFTLSQDKHPAPDTPRLAYPGDSEFGRMVNSQRNADGLLDRDKIVLETAFAASVVSLVKLGIGIGWVPQSLIREDLRKGEIVPLARDYGRIPIDVVLSTQKRNEFGSHVLAALLSTEPLRV
ncbi:MAG: LysR family transcriptional regulator [Pseudomonadota bacterium]